MFVFLLSRTYFKVIKASYKFNNILMKNKKINIYYLVQIFFLVFNRLPPLTLSYNYFTLLDRFNNCLTF